MDSWPVYEHQELQAALFTLLAFKSIEKISVLSVANLVLWAVCLIAGPFSMYVHLKENNSS